MKKSMKFKLAATWILFSRSFDAFCTYRHTPDLSKEANPLVSVAGISSWTMLLIIVSVLTAYALYAYYKSVFKPVSLLPAEKGFSFGAFAAFIYLGRRDNWTAIFYKFPADMNRFHQYMGQLLSGLLVYSGIVSTAMWLLIRHTEFYKNIHSPALIYSILVSGCVIIAYVLNRMLYRQYLQTTLIEKS